MLTDFLDRFSVPWSKTDKHSRSGWTQIQRCGRCTNENYHLGIKDDLSWANCYTCGNWNIRKLLKELTDAPWSAINELLGDRAYVQQETPKSLGRYTPPTNLMPIAEVPAVADYLRGRGFNLGYLEKYWGIQATGPFSDYPMRAFIPVYLNRRPVSWTARAACGQEPRYQTAQAHQKCFDEKHLLFGSNYVRDTAIVTEGCFDAIRVGRGAVATFGLAVTQFQLAEIARVWKRVIVFDSSPQAQARAKVLAEQLAVFPGETVRIELEAADPGEASEAEVKKLRKFVFGE
jgi:hypothetical protein